MSGATNDGSMQFWQISGSRALTAQRSLKKMKKVKTQLMSLLKAYLRTPRVQRALSLKPGEKGFSLIELVVVVAVLAILAAIAIPSFTSINDDARVTGAKTTLANLAKECAVKLVNDNVNDDNYNLPTLSAYEIAVTTGAEGTCGNDDVYQANPNAGINLPTFILNTTNGAKLCDPADSGSNAELGCSDPVEIAIPDPDGGDPVIITRGTW